MAQYPCNEEGVCMRCNLTPPVETECLSCITCGTPWHVSCLSYPPKTLESTRNWECPDCSDDIDLVPVSGIAGVGSSSDSVLVAAMRAIQADESLTEAQKAKKKQQLVSGKAGEDDEEEEKNAGGDVDVLAALRENFFCSICQDLPERPVTTPCGHNFCLKCFQKWVALKKFKCVKCCRAIPKKMADNPRINDSLVAAIRLAKVTKSAPKGNAKVYHFISNQNRPDQAFRTARAKKTGKANAASGKIYVTIPPDHFGPIPAENDPIRNQGVLVGESWADRLDCRQWGAHFPHIAGIAGQADYGAQSVTLSGGYVDDEDHGEWFLYTGSGGRDLSGNKRTNKKQSSDQMFTKSNEALRVSCKMGYPVRVVRSHKEKRSAYAPGTKVVRYDGVYRIEKCWRKVGLQGKFEVCRYLFVRCDNEPAPWTSDEHGDRPRDLPDIPELKEASDLFERKQAETPSWGFDESEGRWKWIKAPPASRKSVEALDPEERRALNRAIKARSHSVKNKLLKEFSCRICREVMNAPVTTPCGHNFCKGCLEGRFAGVSHVRDRSRGGRTLRSQKNVMKCPCCPTDISEFLQNPEVNREVMGVIEALKEKVEEPAPEEEGGESSGNTGEENVESSEGGSMESGEGESQMVGCEDEPPAKKMKLGAEQGVVTVTV